MRFVVFSLELLLAASFFILRELPKIQAYEAVHPRVFVLAEFLIFVAIVDAIRRAVRFWYAKNYGLRRSEKANFQYGIDNIAKVVILLGVGVHLFKLFGVDIRTLLTSLSIVAAAVAIITKEYINDFLVGLYFSFSKNFEIHDYVKMGEHKGKITELQVLKVRILNDDDDSVLIPNGKIYNTEIINYTRRDIRLMSIDFELNINNIDSIERLEADLATSLADFSESIEAGSFNLRIVEMKKDAVSLKFQYTLKKVDRELQQQIRKKTVRQVFNHIAAKAISGQKDSNVT